MPASTRTSTNWIGAAASSDVFSTLPYDIHLAIASHLDLLSIVALIKVRRFAPFFIQRCDHSSYLPQTSKALHALLAHSLAVWRNSVQLQAFRDGIAPFSFPINSMTIEELVQHCARQLQLRSLIHKASTWPSGDFEDVLSKDNLPMRFRISRNSDFKLSDDNDRSDYSAKPIQFVKLLPGGRWLVGCMQHHRVVRTLCWDLQNCTYGERMLPASFIDSANQLLETIDPSDGHFAAQPRDDYARVAVLVSYGTADNGTAVEVLLLAWLPNSTPRFERSGTLLLDQQPHELRISLDGDFVLVQRGLMIQLWEWTKGQDKVMESILPNGTIGVVLRSPFLLAISEDLPQIGYYRIDHSAVHKVGEFDLARNTSEANGHLEDCGLLDTWAPPSPARVSFLEIVENSDDDPIVYHTVLIPPITEWDTLTSARILTSFTSSNREYQPLPDHLGVIGWSTELWSPVSTNSHIPGCVHIYNNTAHSATSIPLLSTVPSPVPPIGLFTITLMKAVQFCVHSGRLLIQIHPSANPDFITSVYDLSDVGSFLPIEALPALPF